jgi:hypothetical protein
MLRKIRFRPVLSVFFLVLVGCGKGDGFQSVSGSVTFGGQPIEEGAIQFFTAGPSPYPVAGAMIKEGKYMVPADHGLKPGNYGVRISSTIKAKNTGPAAEMNPFIAKELIPAHYNTQSTLSIDIAAGANDNADFHLK